MCRGYEHIEDLNVSTSEEKESETREIEGNVDEGRPEIKVEETSDSSNPEVEEESKIKMEG